MKSDEFWDYEKQVDLEAFSSNEFYSILSKQSRDVTSSIARQKDQVSHFFFGFFLSLATYYFYSVIFIRSHNPFFRLS